ncbi:CD44 antigen isoform X2 [Astyanax mexicanus]|uniref:CD44 antigen isoform X2 n=1 Tax=Astyanax mexicanus TaxID=7994 RepID=UPI0020CAB0A5|nr:CD44 antigen isoform X2 [Astyanax mexicanus]
MSTLSASMWIVFCLGLTFGLLASSWASPTQVAKVKSCSHKGVFYVQGDERHSLNFTEAEELCKVLGATLASAEQLNASHATGLEMCRYAWISNGDIAIVRQKSNPLCRAGLTGVIVFKPTDPGYDAFCYDNTDDDKNCNNTVNPGAAADPVPKPEDPSDAEPKTEDPDDSYTTAGPEIIPTAPHTSVSAHNETDADEDVETTQSTVLETTEPAGNTEVQSTASYAQPEPQTQQTTEEDEAEKKITTRVPVQDTPGSGMGETHMETLDHTEYTQSTSGHPAATEETTQSPTTPVSEDGYAGSVAPGVGGRMMIPKEDDKPNSGSSDWLIVVGVIVAVAAILLVCAAVATRKRWCGKRQTLMITSKSSSEGNGAAASVASSRAQEREQEMVTLMNKEKIQENGNTEEFTVITLEESPEKNQEA